MTNNYSISNTHVVGILTAKGKQTAITGNLLLFRDLSIHLLKKGIATIVFTTSNLQETQVNGGFIWNDKKKQWMRANYTGIPSVIYNRIPHRKCEETIAFHSFVHWCKVNNIPFFNPSFFKKWDIYSIIQKDTDLRIYLPFSQLLKTKEQVKQLLERYPSLYLKPNNGSKGNGIFVLSKLQDGTYVLKSQQNSYRSSYFTLIWNKKIQDELKRDSYILQRKVHLSTYQQCMYDFRVFAHHVHNRWVISGVGIRQSKFNGITTHVLKGGSIIKLEEVATSNDLKKIFNITSACGKLLQKNYKQHMIKEFSMDIGKSIDGDFFIFDINAKPMKFDEPAIYKTGLHHLIQIFLEYMH